QHEVVCAGPSDELHGCRHSTFGGATGQGQGRPAKSVEWAGKPTQCVQKLASADFALTDKRRDRGHRRNKQEIDAVESLETAVAICRSLGCRSCERLVGDGEAATDALAHLGAVAAPVLFEELAMDLCRLAC